MPESGEDTYFPALRVGIEKSSAVVTIDFCFFVLYGLTDDQKD